MCLLEIRELSKRFGGIIALNSIDLCIEKGDALGIVGPNGAGKTTLFNLICGFHKPDAGRILFHGNSILGLKPHQICKRGIVKTFQLTKPFSALSVFDNIMIGALNEGTPRNQAVSRARTLLEEFKLREYARQPARNLSTGYQKRLELARALATGPEILLLDEIFAGLSSEGKGEILGKLKYYNEAGITIVMVEHLSPIITAIANKIMVLDHGNKIAHGQAEEILKDRRIVEKYVKKDEGTAIR